MPDLGPQQEMIDKWQFPLKLHEVEIKAMDNDVAVWKLASPSPGPSLKIASQAVMARLERTGGILRALGYGVTTPVNSMRIWGRTRSRPIMTTGGSTRETIGVARAAGARVVGAGAIIDRSGGQKLDVPFHALARVSLPTYDPASCPLCAAGQPVVKPGSRV